MHCCCVIPPTHCLVSTLVEGLLHVVGSDMTSTSAGIDGCICDPPALRAGRGRAVHAAGAPTAQGGDGRRWRQSGGSIQSCRMGDKQKRSPCKVSSSVVCRLCPWMARGDTSPEDSCHLGSPTSEIRVPELDAIILAYWLWLFVLHSSSCSL